MTDYWKSGWTQFAVVLCGTKQGERIVALKVVGAGFGRTGTMSLKKVLEMLGLGPCYHMAELHEHPEHLPHWVDAMKTGRADWDALFTGYNSAVDWPVAYYWRELAAHYPDAKVLLSVRPAEAWVKSIRATIFPALRTVVDMPPGPERDRREMTYEIIARRTFGERFDDEDFLRAVYEANIEEVQRSIPPERLLTYDVEEGWTPLCAFLGVPVPEEPFPFTNTTKEFQERARERARAREAAQKG